jgi:hypothetical protein
MDTSRGEASGVVGCTLGRMAISSSHSRRAVLRGDSPWSIIPAGSS